MKKENAYDFQKRLLQIHEPGLRAAEKKPTADELELKEGVRIEWAPELGEVAQTAANDFADYLRVSMGFSHVTVTSGLTDTVGAIRIHPISEENAGALGEANQYKGFLIDANDSVEIYAHDERGAAQALYYMEDIMTFAHAPFLPREEIRRWAMFSPQMVHSAYGLDEYPDEYLARIAHEGRDAILVFTKDVNKTPSGYLNFNELIHRAARYGLDVYAYSYLQSEVSPEAPEAEEYYEGTYGRLFRECPGLAGVTLVGESNEFPSRDPRVAKGRNRDKMKSGILDERPTSGWYPCEDYPVWLNLVKRIIRKYKSDADIVFWTYNWGWAPEEDRIRLIESLPTDISLQATFEMFEPKKVGNSVLRCADYTLSFEGHGKYFESEAVAAKKRGIRLYSMTNTGGLTWDMGVIPYEPMPFQWIRRYDAMRKAKDNWGLCGIMECHHYGFYPSFISKLSKWSFMEPRMDMEKIAETVIRSEFGEMNYEMADRALHSWSDAIRCYTPTNHDQYGAFRVGPSYPFCLNFVANVPSQEGAMFGNRIVTPTYDMGPSRESTYPAIRLLDEIKSLEKMYELLQEGLTALESAPEQNEKVESLITLGKFMLCITESGLHAKQWSRLKCRLNAELDKDEAAKILDEMEALLRSEIDNAKRAIPLVEADSRLGWEPSMLYITDREHLEWKIRQVEAVIAVEIKNYRESLKY